MIGSSVDKETVRVCRLARAHAKRHLSSEDVRNGARNGLAPGDPRKVFEKKGAPIVLSTGARMVPGFYCWG